MEMDIFEAIRKRHSYRAAFQDKPVPEVHLIKIVETGIAAPSGKNYQTTDFVIITKPECINQIAQITGHPYLNTAKAIIVCIIPELTPVYHGYSFEVEDCAAATENMLLAITALGYATVWLDGVLRINERAEKIGSLINIPQGKKIRIILPIGVPVEQWIQKEKKPFAERAWFHTYPDCDRAAETPERS